MPFPVPFLRSLYTPFESEQVFLSAALLIDSLVRTLQVGSLYALMALGLTLTMAVIKLPNFAHAELITVGAYAALVISMGCFEQPVAGAGRGLPCVGIGGARSAIASSTGRWTRSIRRCTR